MLVLVKRQRCLQPIIIKKLMACIRGKCSRGSGGNHLANLRWQWDLSPRVHYFATIGTLVGVAEAVVAICPVAAMLIKLHGKRFDTVRLESHLIISLNNYA